MENFIDRNFVTRTLTVYKPRQTDEKGFLYVLQRQSDVEKLRNGEIEHILMHKIGLTKQKRVETRVAQQSRANKEQYKILCYF